ncbi:MAG: hypothetical protein IPP72_01460 [Chitinophagaceae bacterium]|nr:hypothetical protein [Chitinophagaceae bacterium]
MKFQARLTNLVATVVLLVTPLIGICQPPPPDQGGGNPEVPFDNNMNLIFLAAGILFAVIITVRQLRKRASATA